MKVAGYIRISTQEQAQGHGLDFQEEAIRQYCEANSLELVEVYRDIESGTKRIRKGLNQLFTDRSNFDCIVVYHTDRVSRKLEHLLQIIDQIAKDGMVLVSTSQPELSISSPTGKLIFSILGAVGEFELSRITERMVKGREMAKQKGVSECRKPRYEERKEWTINPDGTVTKKLIQDVTVVETVHVIKNHRRSGKSYREIARYLNKHGDRYPNKSGKDWNYKTVQALCKRA
jgi:site-specific DNA recombinase